MTNQYNDRDDWGCGEGPCNYREEIERLRVWQSRATQVLPLIERHAGTQLAEFVNTLLNNEVPPSTGAPEFDRPAVEPRAVPTLEDDWVLVTEQPAEPGQFIDGKEVVAWRTYRRTVKSDAGK